MTQEKASASDTPSDELVRPDREVDETDRLKEELRQEHDRYLRALADFDNYRRRVERERAHAAKASQREIILSLLDALDGFDRALASIAYADPSVADGLRLIHRQLIAMLAAHGVTPFESLGQPFDPTRHEAIGSGQSEEYEPGSVMEELRRGYRWDDEVLRPARVRVAA